MNERCAVLTFPSSFTFSTTTDHSEGILLQMKHLEKQKRGKAKLKSLGAGNIQVPQTAFFEVLSNNGGSKSG